MALRGEAEDQPTYTSLRPIQAGSSQTFMAHHALFDGPVVQKTVPLGTAPDAVAANEPQLLENLDHPGIPRVREAQYDPDRRNHLTFVMKVVGDCDLAEVLRTPDAQFSVGRAVDVALQALSIHDYLYTNHRILHRDVKLDNYRISRALDRLWVIDFNLAGRLDPRDRSMKAVRTPFQYMAPEVPQTGRYTVASEIYSLGLMLIEVTTNRMLSGEYPMEKAERRVAQRGERAWPTRVLEDWPHHVPASLRTILRKAVRKDPGARYGTIREFRREFERLLYIDWEPPREDEGGRTWFGMWPPSARPSERTDLRVDVRTLKSGPNAGRLRAVARYRANPTSDWRRIGGLPDRTCEAESALAQFFEDVSSRVAQLRPA